MMKGIDVGGQALDIPTTMAIIDSGTTLAYLPHVVYNTLMNKVTTDISEIMQLAYSLERLRRMYAWIFF